MTPHLTDHDLQLAADAAPLPAAAAAHLPDCRQCQARLATYRQLFAAAAHLPPSAFEFDLAATVLARLPRAKPAFPWALGLVAFLVLSVVGTFLTLFGGVLVQAFQGLSTGLSSGLAVVAGLLLAGQSLALLAWHRRQMSQLAFS